ncbi:MAG: hypothetical protein R3272_08740 [Candidatus Promineifilaceae bacterium]|nr:hypothetical protein [Candidatus Promineifilaceae bacterium]
MMTIPEPEPILEDGPVATGEQARPWPVRFLTFMLAIQGAVMAVIGLLSVDLSAGWHALLVDSSYFQALPPLGVLALIAAIGFYSLRPGAWVMAMLVEGLTLLFTLIVYFRYRPDNVLLYGIMVYAIAMVVYLNYAEVPAIFRVQPGTGEEELA